MTDHWNNSRVAEALQVLGQNPATGMEAAIIADFTSALYALSKRNSEIEILEIKLKIASAALALRLR